MIAKTMIVQATIIQQPPKVSSWADNCGKFSGELGSCFPRRANFRLTPEVKDKFTGSWSSDPPAKQWTFE